MKLDTLFAQKYFCDEEPDYRAALDTLLNRTGEGREYLGWLDLPVNYDKEEFKRILCCAEKIRSESEVLIVIGIGGSYLGARAVIEFLGSEFHNQLYPHVPEIYFAGNSLSGDTVNNLIRIIGERDFSVNVISKSGTSTEPGVSFRIFKNLLEKKYGKEEAAKRIYATTDREKGALKAMADAEGYESFVVPDDIGGRYSVLSPVGLLPIAVAGIDIHALLMGAAHQRDNCLLPYAENDALRYAVARQRLYRAGKNLEILACSEPCFHYMAEWWKQLFAESEGKDGKGIYPSSVNFTTDLHSVGQYIQDGIRNIQETIVTFSHPKSDYTVPFAEGNPDGLDYLAGLNMSEINEKAVLATAVAHRDGGVPVSILHFDEFNAYNVGQMIYFFEFACGVSAYISGVNPFNQPGVEIYKRNMFHLLGKPGYDRL